MASSSSAVEEAAPPWQELPRDVTRLILQKLGVLEILTTAQYVCTTWRSVCRDPSMWRSFDMREMIRSIDTMDDDRFLDIRPDKLCRLAVDLSQGQLTDIYIDYGTDELLLYISRRCGQLRCLQIVNGYGLTSKLLTKAIKNFPLLEKLHLHYNTSIDVEAVGRSCPLLKSFTLKYRWYRHRLVCECVSDRDALAIAENMPGLRHLQLFGNRMTDKGLLAILDGCPNLRSLDLRRCFKIGSDEEMRKLCSQRIEDLRLPHDPMDDGDSDVSASGEEDNLSDFDDVCADCQQLFSGGSVSSYDYDWNESWNEYQDDPYEYY